MAHSNHDFRREVLDAVTSTDGIPDYLLLTVRMLRGAFPSGMVIDSLDYAALWLFLEEEGCSPSAIAYALDFAFDLGYLQVRNARGQAETAEQRDREIARVEELLRPHGLEQWRAEGRDNPPMQRTGGNGIL